MQNQLNIKQDITLKLWRCKICFNLLWVSKNKLCDISFLHRGDPTTLEPATSCHMTVTWSPHQDVEEVNVKYKNTLIVLYKHQHAQ